MNERRLELDMQWKQVAAAAKISVESLGAIRRGANRPSDLTARRLDEALKWAPGSVEAVLDGGDPAPVEQRAGRDPGESAAAEKGFDPLAGLPEDFDEALAEIARRNKALADWIEERTGERPYPREPRRETG